MTTNTARYISGYLDTATGMYKLGARYYDPTAGRFTQYDPSGQEANPYVYAAGNPISFSDVTGLMTDAEAELTGQIVTAAFDVAAIGLIAGTGGAAALPIGLLWGAAGGSIGGGVAATLQGGSSAEIQSASLLGAGYGALGAFFSPA